MTAAIQFQANKRTYTVNTIQSLSNLSAQLKKNGFDGNVYFAEAKASGRQRKDFQGMFYRTVDGQFISAV